MHKPISQIINGCQDPSVSRNVKRLIAIVKKKKKSKKILQIKNKKWFIRLGMISKLSKFLLKFLKRGYELSSFDISDLGSYYSESLVFEVELGYKRDYNICYPLKREILNNV